MKLMFFRNDRQGARVPIVFIADRSRWESTEPPQQSSSNGEQPEYRQSTLEVLLGIPSVGLVRVVLCCAVYLPYNLVETLCFSLDPFLSILSSTF